MWEQDRGSGHLNRRPGFLCHLLSLPELQEKNRKPPLCQDTTWHILHELPREFDGKAAEEIQGGCPGKSTREGELAYDH